jgi:hypothetical protein
MMEHRQPLALDAVPPARADRPRREDGWLAAGVEPALEELLEDPVMALL